MAILKVSSDLMLNQHLYYMVVWAYGPLKHVKHFSDILVDVYFVDIPEFKKNETVVLSLYENGLMIANGEGGYEFKLQPDLFSTN